MLDVRRLRLLREVAERGSIAAAAKALSFTPSAISQQLATFEGEVGVKLVERNGRGIRLTDAAKLLVGHADDVLARLELAEADLAASKGVVRGVVRIAAFPTVAATVLPRAVTRFLESHEQADVTIDELEPEASLPALKSGLVDVALIYEYDLLPPLTDPGIEKEELLRDQLYAALPTGHPAASGRSVRLADLASACWGSSDPDTACARALERACNAAGFEPSISYRSNDFNAILSLVGAGLGVALIPSLACLRDDDGVVLKPISDKPIARRISSAVRRGSGRHPARRALLEALRETAREYADSASARVAQRPKELA